MQVKNKLSKRLKIFGKLILLVTLIWSGNNFGQETSPDSAKKILTLSDCLRIAMENNHKIKYSKEDVNIASSMKKQAESAYWPQISGQAIYTITNKDLTFIMPSFNMSLPPISMLGYTITMDKIQVPQQNIKMMDKQNIHGIIDLIYPLYTGGKVQAINREAENGIEIAKQDFKKSSLEVRYDVKRIYYGALAAKKVYKIGTDALERLNVTLELTESVYKNGSGKTTKLDYLKNKVIVDAVRTIVDQLKENVKLTRDALTFTLGVTDDFDLPDEEIPFYTDGLNVDSLLTQAYGNNPDWKKVNSAVSVYQSKIDDAKSGYLPSIALIGSFNQNINSYKYGMVNPNNSSIWAIGLGAEIPIFNGFRTAGEVEENEALLKKIKEQKLLLHDAIILQINAVIGRLESSVKNVNNTLQSKLTAEENSNLTEKAFQQDMAEAKDLVQAQIMESLMDVQYQKALYDHVEAEANLELILGNGIN